MAIFPNLKKMSNEGLISEIISTIRSMSYLERNPKMFTEIEELREKLNGLKSEAAKRMN